MAQEILLTKDAYEKKHAELEELKTTGRDNIAEKIKEARSFGDLSENSEYDEALNEQAKLEARISKLENELKAEEEELEEEPAEEEETETRKDNKKMEVRKFFNVPSNERDAMFEREDVKAEVLADYQEQLEKDWVAQLRKKYSVVVNREVLKTVNKH